MFELERQKQDVIVVAHQAVLRCLYAYFTDLPLEDCPFVQIPLHTMYVPRPILHSFATSFSYFTFLQHQQRSKLLYNLENDGFVNLFAAPLWSSNAFFALDFRAIAFNSLPRLTSANKRSSSSSLTRPTTSSSNETQNLHPLLSNVLFNTPNLALH